MKRPVILEYAFFALILFGVATVILITSCGEDTQIAPSISEEKPHIVPDCEPKPVSDAGSDKYIIAKKDSPDFVKIGTPESKGSEYEWSPGLGIDSPKSATTLARPTKTTVYTLTVKNACGVAKSGVTIHVLKSTLAAESFKVTAKDKFGKKQEYFTGYVPSEMQYHRAQYLHMPKNGFNRLAPEELDLTPPSFHVNRQPNGSCWAEGARSSAEAGLFYIMKKAVHVSTQRIIDCSGFGSAQFGGQISIDDFLPPNGVVYEADYPYTGYDQKCKKTAPFHEQAKKTYIVRHEDGGKATWPDVKNASAAFGMMEICGSAGALGNGGWDSTPDSGAENHCYSNFGYLKGDIHGQPPGDYMIVQNSWGQDWGGGKGLHPGQGAYRIAPNGVDIKGSVLTENKVAVFEAVCPPPTSDGGEDKTILKIPGTGQSVKIGTPAVKGQTYSWSPEDGLDDPKIAEPIASPEKTTVYTVFARNDCATVSSKVVVRVYQEINGEMAEVR